MSKSSTDENNSYNFRIDSGKVVCTYKNAIGARTDLTSNDVVIPSTETWYHVAMAVTVATPFAKIWINASEVDVTADQSNATDIRDTNAKFTIGAKDDGPGGITNEVDGFIDEPSIYAGLLDQNMVNILFNGGAGIGYNGITESNIKKAMGVPLADIKKIGGTAIADVKVLGGVSNA